MTTRTVAGIKLTYTPKGWAAPNERFVFHRDHEGWTVADYGHLPSDIPIHPLMSYGSVWATLELAVEEAKQLLDLG